MAKTGRIGSQKEQARKQPRRPHFIPEWAEKRGYPRPTDLAEALEVDKSTVSRWYNGATPGEEWQEGLAEFFQCDREALFRHPGEDWFVRFFREREDEEVERAKQLLELTFPRKAS